MRKADAKGGALGGRRGSREFARAKAGVRGQESDARSLESEVEVGRIDHGQDARATAELICVHGHLGPALREWDPAGAGQAPFRVGAGSPWYGGHHSPIIPRSGSAKASGTGEDPRKKECLFLTNEAIMLLKTKDRQNERSQTKPISERRNPKSRKPKIETGHSKFETQNRQRNPAARDCGFFT